MGRGKAETVIYTNFLEGRDSGITRKFTLHDKSSQITKDRFMTVIYHLNYLSTQISMLLNCVRPPVNRTHKYSHISFLGSKWV